MPVFYLQHIYKQLLRNNPHVRVCTQNEYTQSTRPNLHVHVSTQELLLARLYSWVCSASAASASWYSASSCMSIIMFTRAKMSVAFSD